MVKRLCILISFLIFFLGVRVTSAKIAQVYAPKEIQILDFVSVSSNQNGEILTKTFKLKVENKGQEPLYNVRFTLIYASDQVSINEGEVYLGNINPGETVVSDDDFSYSVDMSKIKIIPEINLHWEVEYIDVYRERQGEVLIKEKF
ncbi:hypothetical protein J7J39_01120 [bacterium]|nr:hypothetical protein [bacterium]